MGAPMRSVIPGSEGELAAAGVGPVPGGRDGPPAGACSSDAGPVMPENAEIHLKKSMANTQKKSEGSPSTLFSEDASKPVSRVLSFKTAIYLDAPLPVRSSRLPGTVGPTCVSLHGVAPDRVYSDGQFPAVGWALTSPFHPYLTGASFISLASPKGKLAHSTAPPPPLTGDRGGISLLHFS